MEIVEIKKAYTKKWKSPTYCMKNGRKNLHPIYQVWRDMRKRCHKPLNKDYKDYGGRGIAVCKEWRESYDLFYDWAMSHGYEYGLQLDRIDNDDGYNPENCHFVTRQENNLNKRKQKNSTSQYRGVHLVSNKYWIAQVRYNKQQIYIGTFRNELGAAISYNDFVIQNNFPNQLNDIPM